MNTGNTADEFAQHHGKENPKPTAEKPLAGAVICCTSVAPEVRSHLAECAHQMGAEHKLDLTSDVTHLLVGDADTLKYKYVAREREDVQVLRPDWIEAVRSRWMNAKNIDLNALAVEYRLPTFFGLKICITGFDDLTFRSRMQENVIENGGEYTGDLTKDVTHLIAARAEGKKYEYGTQWQKKVVSLKWYKDTLSRGMQLDESLYHPSKPIDEQGIGAWNRFQPSTRLGKRAREEISGPEPLRKLRRTASTRLGSQNDNLWTDIVGGGFETSEAERPLRPSKSVAVHETRHVRSGLDGQFDEKPNIVSIGSGYLDEKYFLIHGFDQRRQAMLRQILLDLGGTVLDTMQQLADAVGSEHTVKIVIVPYETSSEQVATQLQGIQSCVVSELWLEHCMFKKCYVPPNDYPLSSLTSRTKPAGFSRLRLNATGFSGIQVLHISKMVKLLGGQYEQKFTSDISALICNKGGDNLQKLSHASVWQVPAVSESWLISCIRENRTASFEKHLVQPVRQKGSDIAGHSKHGHATKQNLDENQRGLQDIRKPGSDFLLYEDTDSGTLPIPKEKRRDPNKSKDDENVASAKEPLQEISPNSPTKPSASVSEPKQKARLFRTLDGPSSVPEATSAIENMDSAKPDTKSDAPPSLGLKTVGIASEIQDFYSMRANAKSSNCSVQEAPSRRGRLQGRALSNLSNGSITSAARLSRASSVDSINTDGVGSEIAPVTSTHKKSQDLGENRNFTGRAKSRLFDGAGPSIELADSGLYTREMVAEETAPQMTQLLYDDSEDTIALREKLAAKRRQRSRLGQKEDDPKPGELKEPRRIRDDDIVTTEGWGAGGRTRHKVKSPPGLKGF